MTAPGFQIKIETVSIDPKDILAMYVVRPAPPPKDDVMNGKAVKIAQSEQIQFVDPLITVSVKNLYRHGLKVIVIQDGPVEQDETSS